MPPTFPECLHVQYLNLQPCEDGLVQFTFVDTFKEEKQWKRTANKDDICERLKGFVLQVGWSNHFSS